MSRARALSILLVVAALTGCSAAEPPATRDVAACPTTTPRAGVFAPPAQFPAQAPYPSQYWFGSGRLWTALPISGTWSDLPRTGGAYSQKLFWWSTLFSAVEEPRPDLRVRGARLDGDSPPLVASVPSNASAGDIGSAMVIGLDFPAAGCWQITGEYRGATLSFIVAVTP